jgi:hypothetical protein
MSINYDKFNTYMAASSAFDPGATPQDVFTITGNATTNVYVLKMGISSVQTTAGISNWFVTKRSAANTGGTSAAVTAVPVASGEPAAAATVLQYTAVATGVGAAVGNVWAGHKPSLDVAATGMGLQTLEINFQSVLGQPIALLSAAEVLSWNFNGAAKPAGLSVLAWVLWAEASKT